MSSVPSQYYDICRTKMYQYQYTPVQSCMLQYQSGYTAYTRITQHHDLM